MAPNPFPTSMISPARRLDDYNMKMYGAAQSAGSSRFTVVEAVVYGEKPRTPQDARGSRLVTVPSLLAAFEAELVEEHTYLAVCVRGNVEREVDVEILSRSLGNEFHLLVHRLVELQRVAVVYV